MKKEGFNLLNYTCKWPLMKFFPIFVLSSVFPDLLKAIPVSIHVNVILFSTILIVLTLVGTAFFMYNAFGKPFETLHGPLGLYLLSFISGEYKILPLKTNGLVSVQKIHLPTCKTTVHIYGHSLWQYLWEQKAEKRIIIQQERSQQIPDGSLSN